MKKIINEREIIARGLSSHAGIHPQHGRSFEKLIKRESRALTSAGSGPAAGGSRAVIAYLRRSAETQAPGLGGPDSGEWFNSDQAPEFREQTARYGDQLSQRELAADAKLLELQQKIQLRTQRMSLLSNTLKTHHDTAKNTINNIR